MVLYQASVEEAVEAEEVLEVEGREQQTRQQRMQDQSQQLFHPTEVLSWSHRYKGMYLWVPN